MDRPGVRQVPEVGGEQEKMEETGCEIICGASATLTVKGQIKLDEIFKCDKNRALRNVITHLALLVHSISVTMIRFQGHSKVKQLRKFKVAYFDKCLPIQFKWQYPHLTPSVPHAQTLHRYRNNTD